VLGLPERTARWGADLVTRALAAQLAVHHL